MSNITDYLQGIMSARYGKDVRKDIHDAIEACYADGRVGATDTTARNAIAALTARVTALEGAGSTGLTTGTLTLEDGFTVFQSQTPVCAKIGPIVQVWGSVRSTNDIPFATAGAEYLVATIPQGFRPYADMGLSQSQGYVGENNYFLDIRTTGEVYIKYPNASPIVASRAINLDMIFIAEDADTSGTDTLDEVEDARIGWDATLYQSLGDAIRGQISAIRTDLQDALDAADAAESSAVEAAELVDGLTFEEMSSQVTIPSAYASVIETCNLFKFGRIGIINVKINGTMPVDEWVDLLTLPTVCKPHTIYACTVGYTFETDFAVGAQAMVTNLGALKVRLPEALAQTTNTMRINGLFVIASGNS